MAPFLKEALAWVNQGKVPSGLVGHVAEKCLNAGLGYKPLDDDAMRVLMALDATGGHWQQVANFLREVAAGRDPPMPPKVTEPIRTNLMRVSLTSRLAGVQQPRILDIISVGFGDPWTGVDLFSLTEALVELRGRVTELPQEAEEAIRKFEKGASERATVAQRLRALIAETPLMPPADNLPIALRLVLPQIEAVAKRQVIPLAPSVVGLAAIRTRHGGGPMGDCILFSLRAMASGDTEAEMLANYLWSIANGGPAGPAPALTDPHLAETAEEVRCLADKEVGGIRLLMTKTAPQENESQSNDGTQEAAQ